MVSESALHSFLVEIQEKLKLPETGDSGACS